MAINFSSGFNITSSESIDTRLLKTKSEMASMSSIVEMRMPDPYFCICKDDGKLYIFKKSNEKLTDIGKYRLVDEQVLSNTTLFETALANSVAFTALVTKVGDAEAGTGLAGDVKTLQTDVTELKTDVNTLKPEVAQLKQEVEDPESGLAKRIQALEGRLDTAEERMEEIEERIAAIKLENIPGTLDGGTVTQ